jgi:predicted amidohydrolase YtcJ
MLDPYEPRPSGTGLQKRAPADLSTLVAALDKQEWQITVEANGDGAVRSALDAYEAIAAAPAPPRGRRHRIDGLEVISPEDLPRLRPLGLIATLQPLHGTSDRLQIWRRNLGPDRAALGWASESLTKAGAHLAFGTDWPNLPMDPLAGLTAAVYRTVTPEGPETLPESERAPDARLDELEKLPLKSAINAWTSGAAWASFDEHRKGVIKPGMLADLVVLSSDIFSGPASRLASTEVNVTIFDGKVVYQRDQRHSTN